jgi:hypothetical protein
VSSRVYGSAGYMLSAICRFCAAAHTKPTTKVMLHGILHCQETAGTAPKGVVAVTLSLVLQLSTDSLSPTACTCKMPPALISCVITFVLACRPCMPTASATAT